MIQNDLLQWALEEAIERGDTLDSVIRVILVVNFAAIHTSSNVGLLFP